MILENELLSAGEIKALALETAFEVEVQHYLSANEALAVMKEEVFDVFIIRLNSSKEDEGVSFVKILRQMKIYEMINIIFIVDREDSAIRKIIQDEFYSFWVLTTPINEALELKFKEILSLFLVHKSSDEREKKYITMINDEGIKYINCADILFVDIVGKVVTINFIDGTIDRYPNGYYSLRKMKIALGEGFIQIFKSTIINKDYVVNIDYDASLVTLEGRDKPLQLGGPRFSVGVRNCFGDGESLSKMQ